MYEKPALEDEQTFDATGRILIARGRFNYL
jgi:hypothetical protein